MNTRSILSAVFAAGILCTPALAQAPAPSTDPTSQAKIERLQAQVNALQAQVRRLQAQIRASSPSATAGPFPQIPNLVIPDYHVPNYKIAPFQNPGILQSPSIQGFQSPGVQGQPPQVLVPRTYSNIPPCALTFISQKTR